MKGKVYHYYSANDIARWFLEQGLKDGVEMTVMKVIKLTYIAQGIHLALYNQPLFYNSIEAWKYGPVVKSVYQLVRTFGKNPIQSLEFLDTEGVKGVNPQDAETIEVLDSVMRVFGGWNGYKLSNWTHRSTSAWAKTYKKYGGLKMLGDDINLEWLKEEFEEFVINPGRERKTQIGKGEQKDDR